ncbi:MAG: Sec-independent protein translocase protein TatB [Gammaproteobacteria bacterium]
MFDVGFAELILIFVIALIVLGPERLPEVARTAGRWLGRARQMARSMQYELERELDVNNIGKDIAGDGSSSATESAPESPSEAATDVPPPTHGRLPERTGASYDDDPEDLDEDFHADDDADASKVEKAGG